MNEMKECIGLLERAEKAGAGGEQQDCFEAVISKLVVKYLNQAIWQGHYCKDAIETLKGSIESTIDNWDE